MLSDFNSSTSVQTSTTLSFFMYAMIQYPKAQEQAQKELDRVVGRLRSPNFTDMAHLPYIRAIVKEVGWPFCLLFYVHFIDDHQVLRWQPAIPLVVPRMAMEVFLRLVIRRINTYNFFFPG